LSEETKSATEKKSNRNFVLMKLKTKPLKFKCGLADRGEGWVVGLAGGPVQGRRTRARQADPCKAGGPVQGMGTITQLIIILFQIGCLFYLTYM
jgi:hypothetical protein